MGCIGSRHKFADEEETLAAEQAALGFSRHPLADVDCIVRKYSSDTTINVNQLKAIKQSLSLNLENYETHKSIGAFVAKLQKPGTTEYLSNKVLMTGILLAEAENTQRARALFEIVDKEETGSIDVGKLQNLLTVWIETTLDLGSLADTTPIGLRAKDYIAKCRQSIQRWIDNLKKQLGTTTIAKARFIEVLTTPQNAVFLNCGEFRKYLAEDALKNPQQATKNPKVSFTNLKANMRSNMASASSPAQPGSQAGGSAEVSTSVAQSQPEKAKQEEVKSEEVKKAQA